MAKKNDKKATGNTHYSRYLSALIADNVDGSNPWFWACQYNMIRAGIKGSEIHDNALTAYATAGAV